MHFLVGHLNDDNLQYWEDEFQRYGADYLEDAVLDEYDINKLKEEWEEEVKEGSDLEFQEYLNTNYDTDFEGNYGYLFNPLEVYDWYMPGWVDYSRWHNDIMDEREDEGISIQEIAEKDLWDLLDCFYIIIDGEIHQGDEAVDYVKDYLKPNWKKYAHLTLRWIDCHN